ncbi:MAG TPA: AIM24 family protein [Pyrinomonadaceae bacterium]|nr:AIM24 family protein [Pyrinomonadaceae bacterium]
MKHCPTCQRTFDDEKVFCGSDGTRLISDAPAAPPYDYQSSQPAPTPAPQYTEAPPPQQHAEPPRAATPAHAGPLERIRCEWCQAMNEGTALSCRACGAPLDIKNLVSESGWREAPRIKDMTEIHFGMSTCQVEGEIVPVAEINLGPGDAVFFEHHVMLWKDDRTPMSVMPIQGGIKRALAGMPFIISVAQGPGRIAFSRDATGELVVMPLHPGVELDVREHAFLLASHHISYSYVRIKGLRNILFGGQGMFMDRFVTGGEPGLLLLHGYGNVFERYLQAGESIMVEPGAFLYKDASVTMNVETQKLTSGFFGGTGMNLARMTGPGRVGIQSMYVHHHTD